jgi:glycosyltransferase involved in cell wall biosynthesis
MPKLTVLMTVYNGEDYLRETIESILDQTYRDFKFLILDNASTDSSREIIRSYHDPRIQLVALPENIGQVAALNKGLDMIDTPLVARMDADDISLPRRFERQTAFMETHPEVGVLGTFVRVFLQQENQEEIKYRWPTKPEDIKVRLMFECCLPHPGVMLRKTFFHQYSLRYDEKIGHSFDWELWQRAANHFDLANLPEFHLRYRLHPENESKKTAHLQKKAALELYDRSLKQLDLDHHPLRQVHQDVAFETFNAINRGPEFLNRVVQWFRELENANKKHGIYSEESLHRLLRERFFVVLHYNTAHPRLILKMFFKERLYRDVGVFRSIKFLVKVLLCFWGFFRVPGRGPRERRQE